MKNIYEQLRERLDQMGTGYPKTDNGVEIKILEKIFTEEDAELFLKLSPFLETPQAIAQKINEDAVKLEERLEDMAKKGLLFRHRKDDTVKYAAVPYVVGIFEFQLNTMDQELAKYMEEYHEKAFGETIQAHGTPLMRTIPIKRDLAMTLPVAPYEDVLDIIERQDTIAIADCVCRTTAKLAGQGCDYPMEACFLFGSHGKYYVENGMGRFITKDEAREILDNNEKAGLVMQPFNAQNAGGMCSCCGCCCGVMRSLKMQPVPSKAVQSNYYAVVKEDLCTGCMACVKRCHMDAITVTDKKASINLDRCIGCGLCITKCKFDAMELVKKPESELYVPPKSGGETYFEIAKKRGIIK